MKRLVLALTFAAALAAALLLLVPQPAQADAAKAEACLRSLTTSVVASGRRIRATDVFAAGPKESVTYRLTLYKGLQYVLIGCADGEGVNLDMRLYDDQGNLVSNDESPDNQPFVDVAPPKTGEYALQVLVHKSDEAKTDFALAVSYQE
ncbi:MAG: PPC domain-containing protein [Myxococcota bacterium]|nr:PPC domain-containing protein [Myxococcota bacterium]